jgi:hypothetical protein
MIFLSGSIRRVSYAFVSLVVLLPLGGVAQTVYSNLDQASGWASCTVCAGAGGLGGVATYSKSIVLSPSLDGHSAKFNLGGSTPYTNALWWKQLGANSYAHRFVYDLYFYLKNSSAPQALEFDVNQSVGGKKYIFGTECSMKIGVWRIWNYSTHWQSTGVACHPPTTYKWHHLQEEFQRTSTGKVMFVSITLDGNKHYINRTYYPGPSSAKEVNVAFQMDGNKYQTDYSVWLDKVKLTYW